MNRTEWTRPGRALSVALGLLVSVAAAALNTACAHGAGSPAGVPEASSSAPPKALYEVPTTEKVVALTYDDGPGTGEVGTPAVVALLQTHHAKATFFVIGEEVHKRPDVLKAAARAGMEIENHGERHANMTALGETALTRVVSDGARTIQAVTGTRPTFLRPPFGSQSARVRRVAHALGERVVIWSVDTRDWTNPGSATIVARVLTQVRPGSIVLMHDGGANRRQTVTATRELLPALRARGYRMVTLRELVGIGKKAPLAPSAAGAASAGPSGARGNGRPAPATPAGSRSRG